MLLSLAKPGFERREALSGPQIEHHERLMRPGACAYFECVLARCAHGFSARSISSYPLRVLVELIPDLEELLVA